MDAPTKPSLLRRLLGSITGARPGDPPRAAVRDARRAIWLCHALLSERGDVAGARLARETLAAYQGLEDLALGVFFDLLIKEFSPDPQDVVRVADAYRQDPSQPNLIRLQRAVEPRRQELFRRLNTVAGGTAVLLEMRRRVLKQLVERPHWVGIDADLAHLFNSWFNRGFLVLQRIDWRTSAIVLEKLIKYEAVHEIQGWPDLRRRLQADRRCYAFFHPVLPDEPVIFIEVALTRAAAAGAEFGGGRSGIGRLRDLLLDHQLPGRPAGRVIRQPADQAGRRGPGSRISAAEDLRYAVPGPGFSPVAGRKVGRAPGAR